MAAPLSAAQVHNLATAFAIYARRRGGGIAEAWGAWSAAHSYPPREGQWIRQQAHEILFALGHTTEPPPLAA